MEKFLGQYDRDCMKMAMLKHEETFREQVYELHRLYKVQNLLTKQLKACSEYKRLCRFSRRSLSLELPAQEYIEDTERKDSPENEQESDDVELTLSIGSSKRRNKDASDSGSFSSSSTESTGENKKFHNWELFQMANMKTCLPGAGRTYDVKEPSKQDKLDQHAWHYKSLSLKMA